MSEAARARRAAWTTRVRRLDEPDDTFDVEYWQQIPLDERAEAAWRLSLEQWSLKEPGVDHERRLSRSVARVVRR